MKILSFNVGIWTRNWKKTDPFYWKPRMEAMKRMLDEQDPDVICFQELWFPANLFIPHKYRKVIGTGLEHPIYVRRGLKHGLGRFSIYWSMAKVEGVRIFSIHGHWNQKITENLCNGVTKVYSKDYKPAILAGDWNVDYDNLQENTKLLYSAREYLRFDEENTYVHFHDSSRAGELDHFLMYRCWPARYAIVHDCYGAPGGRISDHYPIVLYTSV